MRHNFSTGTGYDSSTITRNERGRINVWSI